MSAPMGDVLAAIEALLTPERFDDYCVNGLQVPGPVTVRVIATGVSAHAQLFELAAAEGADLLLVHHGLFWGAGARVIDATLKQRLRILFDAELALAAYHLPLDAHPELGNNALLARALGAESMQPFALHHGEPIGALAKLPGEGLPASEMFERVQQITAREPVIFDAGPPQVRHVAIVSGAGADYLGEAHAAGAEARSRASSPSARWPRHANWGCISSVPVTTRPRHSGSNGWVSTWRSDLTCATSSSTSPTRSDFNVAKGLVSL